MKNLDTFLPNRLILPDTRR